MMCHLEDDMEKKLQDAHEQVRSLKTALSRHPLEFTVGQYNILAGYMGNLAAKKASWPHSDAKLLGVASTHLQRNPEDPTQDMLRARQVRGWWRSLTGSQKGRE
eukprot:Skav224467  [mRNA]  locus=scaffold1302:435113:442060:- [translate_table: standard]